MLPHKGCYTGPYCCMPLTHFDGISAISDTSLSGTRAGTSGIIASSPAKFAKQCCNPWVFNGCVVVVRVSYTALHRAARLCFSAPQRTLPCLGGGLTSAAGDTGRALPKQGTGHLASHNGPLSHFALPICTLCAGVGAQLPQVPTADKKLVFVQFNRFIICASSFGLL